MAAVYLGHARNQGYKPDAEQTELFGTARRSRTTIMSDQPNTTMLCRLSATGSPRGPHSITFCSV